MVRSVSGVPTGSVGVFGCVPGHVAPPVEPAVVSAGSLGIFHPGEYNRVTTYDIRSGFLDIYDKKM